MKDVIFTITANTRKVVKTKDFMGINGENLQGNIIVDFSDEFIDGYAYLEVDFGASKGFIGMTKVDEHYVLPIQSSLLAVVGKIYCQIRINVPVDANAMSVFKSEVFEIPVLEAINAEGTIPEEYPTWVENADLKLAEVDTAIGAMAQATEQMRQSFSNPNLLINSNFAINQRGENTYTGQVYTVDHWKGNNPATVVTPTNTGITVSGVNFQFIQQIENFSILHGQTVTLSIKAGGNKYSATQTITDTQNTSFCTINISGGFVVRLRRLVSTLFVQILGVSAGTALAIEWVKLEFGDSATIYSPPIIAEELPKCQRYFQTVKNMRVSCCLLQTNLIDFTFPLVATMRTTPTITLGGLTIQSISGGTVSDFTFTSYGDSLTSFKIRATKTAHGITNNASATQATNDPIMLDAEIY